MSASVSRNDILRAYPRATRDPEVMSAAVLDVAFDVVLHQLHRHDLFEACGLVFKGGTALRKHVLGHKGRFSYDLDFNASEDSGAVAEMIDEALRDSSDLGIGLEMTERRGFYSILISSALLPEGQRKAKMDFSQRGLCLPPHNLPLISTPLHASYPFEADFAVPVIDVEENIAEKLSRWYTGPVVRDLSDLSELANRVTDPARVAALFVLKSHRAWHEAAPNRRPAKPADFLTDTLASLSASSFELEGLVLPNAPSEPERRTLVDQHLRRLAGLFDRLDIHIGGAGLQRFANDTDGSLTYAAETELAKIGQSAATGKAYLSGQPPLGFMPMIAPEVEVLGSTTSGQKCGARTTENGRCGHPAPAVGHKCAAGHLRRR